MSIIENNIDLSRYIELLLISDLCLNISTHHLLNYKQNQIKIRHNTKQLKS